MFLSLLLVFLIVGIFVVQSTHGAFSALIMAVLAICCAGAAYGTFESVAIQWFAPRWKPDYAFALALGLTFGVPLLVLRVAADQVITRAPLVPAWADRLGGAVCGLITAIIVTGVIATCLQMLPFNKGIMGFSRVPFPEREKADDGPEPEPHDPAAPEDHLLFEPDRLALGVASVLSDGVFSGRRSLKEANPDLLQAVGWLNTVPSVVSRYAKPKSISVVSTKRLQFVDKYSRPSGGARSGNPGTYEPELPKPGHEFQMVRVQLKQAARDARKSHMFTLRQFRLVGRTSTDDPRLQYHPMAIQQNDLTSEPAEATQDRYISKKRLRGKFWPVDTEVFQPRRGNDNQVEVVFEVAEGFRPDYIEYKRGARAALSFEDGGDLPWQAPSPSDTASQRAPAGESASTVPNSGRGGRVRRFTTRSGRSFFGNKMPAKLTSYRQRRNVEISRGALVDGHLVASAADQDGGSDTEVRTFSVPSDKRLLHLDTEFIKARSTLGRALSIAKETVQNFLVEDSEGRRYKICGKYAVADVDGEQILEVQYFSSPVGSIGGVGRFEKIKDRHLSGDYRYVLLFLVEPGARIASFTTGGSATRRDDLAAEELVAPR